MKKWWLMSQQPDVIYIIRHGEKPTDPPATGVDFHGGQSEHSLLPRGWQRSGALVALFDPDRGGLRTPTALVAPARDDPRKNARHRTHQTIQGLSDRLDLPIVSVFAEGQEASLAASLVRDHSGVVLICWNHTHIPALAASLPAVDGAAIPQKWPNSRFDVVWAFTLAGGSAQARYAFDQIPQRLLAGDDDTIIQL
jgi:hypothetical protein